MKRFYSLSIALLLTVSCESLVWAQAAPDADVGEAEAAVRKSIESYVRVFNQGDAKLLAAHWNEGGQFLTPAGEKLQGRQQLEMDFAKYFAETKGAQIELPESNITFLSPNVAVETGVARVTVADQEPSETEYEAIYVKTPEGWKIDSISEQEVLPPRPSHHEQLQSLDWMVGNWVDSDENASIETTCHWTANENFLVRSFKVNVQDRVDFEGTQIIGWDPHLSTIRSWLFDSDGGFGVGHWSEDDGRWVVRSLNVLPDGKLASSTNIYDKVDENTLQFRSIGRQVEGELMPNIAPITSTRVSE